MSVIISATSLALVAGIPALMALGLNLKKEQELEELEALETCFADSDILRRTLLEHGLVAEERENEFVVTTKAGSIRFFRQEENGAFYALPFDLRLPEELGKCADEIEAEYMLNVQKDNYQLLKGQLGERADMQLESESMLEDGTILLTIQL